MHVTRFYTTLEGGSAFDVFDMPLQSVRTDAWGNTVRFSEPFPSPAVRVYQAPIGMFQEWHNAPTRQLCLMLQGTWEVGTTDGEKRRWGPGEVFMPDTVDGRGHTSEVIGKEDVMMVFVPVPPEVNIEVWGASEV